MLSALLAAVSLVCASCASRPPAAKSDSAYLFTSFRDADQKFLRFLYSFDGCHWTNVPGTFLEANVGTSKQFRDPSLTRGPDGTFHLVWTAGWHGDQGFGCASSKDLIHWSEQKFVPVMTNEPTTVNVWAPEIFFDDGSWRSRRGDEAQIKKNKSYPFPIGNGGISRTPPHPALSPVGGEGGRRPGAGAPDQATRGHWERVSEPPHAGSYIIIWASTIPGRFPDKLEKHDNNHRLYFTTTRDFTNFAPAKLFFDPGFSVIDGFILKDTDRYVLVCKDNSRPRLNLRVAFADSPLGPWQNVSAPFTQKFTEGPCALKIGDDWLVYFDAYRQKIYGAVKTHDFKTFTDVTKEVLFPEGHKHGTALKVPREILDGLLKSEAANSKTNL